MGVNLTPEIGEMDHCGRLGKGWLALARGPRRTRPRTAGRAASNNVGRAKVGFSQPLRANPRGGSSEGRHFANCSYLYPFRYCKLVRTLVKEERLRRWKP